MRVAVYPGGFPLESGGGHSFVASVFGAFLEAAPASRHRFIALLTPMEAAAHEARARSAGVDTVIVPEPGPWQRALDSLQLYSPLARHVLKRAGPIERAARAGNADFLWVV